MANQQNDAVFSEAQIEQLKNLIEPIAAKIDTRLKNLENWTKGQDKALEKEMTESVRLHLSSLNRGYITIIPKTLPDNLPHPDGREITEFDGLVILTNDREYAKYATQKMQEPYKPPQGTILRMIIVEAKQHLTLQKVKTKTKQKLAIESLLSDLKHGYRHKRYSHLIHLGLQYFQPEVGLYIGGSKVDPTANVFLEEYMKNAQSTEYTGSIVPSGTRFRPLDITNDFGKTDVQWGGKHKTTA